MATNYALFVAQLDAFINRYYDYEIRKGILRSLAFLLLLFLLMAGVELLFFFGASEVSVADLGAASGLAGAASGSSILLRTILFWCYVILAAIVLMWQVGVPLWQRYGGSLARGASACGAAAEASAACGGKGLAAWRRFLPVRMSRKEAAKKLAAYFPSLDDKLCNVLELKEITSSDTALIEAAIHQISADFKAYRFTSVFQARQLRPLCGLLAVPLVLTLAFGLFFPSFLGGSSFRLIHPREVFAREFPFEIYVEDSVLTVPYGERYTLHLAAKGDFLPKEVEIWMEERNEAGAVGYVRREACQTVGDGRYRYNFEPLYKNETFRLRAGGYLSRPYSVKVLPPVWLTTLKIDLEYPAYTGMASCRMDEASWSEMGMPYGTRMRWSVGLTETETLQVVEVPMEGAVSVTVEVKAGVATVARATAGKAASQTSSQTSDETLFRFDLSPRQSVYYKLVPQAAAGSEGQTAARRADTLTCRVEVWSDRYPRIEASLADVPREAVGVYTHILQGEISDDYGFHSLVFRVKDEKGALVWSDTLFDATKVLSASASHAAASASGVSASAAGSARSPHAKLFFSENKRWARFVYGLSASALHASSPHPSPELSYELEVRDNDPYNGYKAATSRSFILHLSSPEEKQQQWRESREQTAKSLDSVTKGQNALSEQYRDMGRELLGRSGWNWDDRRKIENMISEQKAQMQALREAIQEMKAQNREDQTEYSDELQEKERQMEELLSQMWNEQAVEKLQQIEEWLKENAPKEQVAEALNQWQEEHREWMQNWERNKEIYKRLEFEKGLEKMTSDLSDLSRLQEDLQARTEEAARELSREKAHKDSAALSALAKEQERLSRRFEEVQRSLESLSKQNEALRRPFKFDLPVGLMEEVSSDMQQAGEDLQEGEPKSAVGHQKQAASNLQKLAKNLSSQQGAMQSNQQAEDAEYLRLLLKEIVNLSFEQERVMGLLQGMSVSDPRYGTVIRRQDRLNRDIAQAADSIRALSERQPQVAVHTQGVLKSLRMDSQKALADLLSMNTTLYRFYRTQNRQAEASQQRSMNGLNELSLLLSESLDQMQMSLSPQKGGGSGSPQQKGGEGEGEESSRQKGKKSDKSGKEKGDGPTLSEMQESLNRGLEALQKAMQGQQQGKGQSEAFMRAAAQQEMIRRALQKQLDEMKRQGGKAQGALQQILGDMEQTERELVHKMITPQMMLRQQQIETRLLEAENAELKQEKEQRRESKEGREFDPFRIEDWKLEGDSLKPVREGLQQKMPPLHPYYKQKIEEYFLR